MKGKKKDRGWGRGNNSGRFFYKMRFKSYDLSLLEKTHVDDDEG